MKVIKTASPNIISDNTVMPRAMILAAGRGKRLRPLTDKTPKPLVKLNGKPLIVYHLEKLAKAGVQEVVINTAWLPEQFPENLGDGSQFGLKIFYSEEPEGGLETAGGVVNALPILGDKPFVLVNSDIYSELDYADWVRKAQQMPERCLAHLCLVPVPDFKDTGDFDLDLHADSPDMLAIGNHWTFSGVSVCSPKLFSGLTPDFIPLAPILREAALRQRISGEVFTGFWSDIGTQQRLQDAENYVKQHAN